jgi:hypothetical protein
MMEVGSRSRADAAATLLGMGLAGLGGYVFLGAFASALARRGIRGPHLFAAGFSLNALALAVIAFDVSSAAAWWWLYGLGGAANILAFGVLNEGFPRELAGRTNTALNLMMFAGGFAMQWGVGIVVEFAFAWLGAPRDTGLRYAFVLLVVLDVAALAWLFHGWKRFSVPSTPAPG